MIRKRQEYTLLPEEVNKNTPIGIGIPFNAPGIFKLNYTTREQIKTNLINLLLTNSGERVFNPEFGGGLKYYLFEQDSSIDTIESLIEDKVKRYVPQAYNISAKVTKDSSMNTVYVGINYSIDGETDNALIQISK
jgi:uncharacterized protein